MTSKVICSDGVVGMIPPMIPLTDNMPTCTTCGQVMSRSIEHPEDWLDEWGFADCEAVFGGYHTVKES
jgi:hypothetical protein